MGFYKYISAPGSRTIFTLILCLNLFTQISVLGQSKYRTSNGEVHFNASTPLEDIDALNKKVRAVLESGTGNFAVMMLIKDFDFPRKLMQEHFNENYMESEEYPKAYFRGTIEDFDQDELSNQIIEKQINGQLTIHGITLDRMENIELVKKGKTIHLRSQFVVRPESHDIEVPKIVFAKIAREVKVEIELELVKDN